MTKEQIAQRNYNEAMMRYAMQNAAPQPSGKKRLDWLEADASAQRTAILKLEREFRRHRETLWVLAACLFGLALGVLT
ncbi:hypothetical protein UFOVP670_16 [uncultured Caudovirales phage]|uniref:Uncharacterized protein n=1 Tax=uncultured Caudovirales phage TaxID=2100421 RepID=A0A6J5NE32_9CAUD|nr:hypothetical protein UFOVP670_16 [uncultured Caudovirales phage]